MCSQKQLLLVWVVIHLSLSTAVYFWDNYQKKSGYIAGSLQCVKSKPMLLHRKQGPCTSQHPGSRYLKLRFVNFLAKRQFCFLLFPTLSFSLYQRSPLPCKEQDWRWHETHPCASKNARLQNDLHATKLEWSITHTHTHKQALAGLFSNWGAWGGSGKITKNYCTHLNRYIYICISNLTADTSWYVTVF